ncbi:DUF6916 family protein [Leucothrix pacifica]|uniref:DUF6916 domain-containing protein n=1 Tax=Leucothrix pacifica TaxID=1247513 RepID=A0A317C103_9GAMM|nr:hypothetical protein [Leucothrix pacifica]PWQ92049.1 hypothetical protein DKW60_23165 [Leucothrix pacifica]
MTTNSQSNVTLAQMTFERMQVLSNDTFYLLDGRELVLVEVAKVERKQALHSWQQPKTDTEEGKRVPFTLVFRFPVGSEDIQGGYDFTHPVEGAFEGVFLTPITSDENGLYLEAIFN